VELGVSEGEYSDFLLSTNLCPLLVSVDLWGGSRGHDDGQYLRVCDRLAKYGKRSRVVRGTFDEALGTFDDDSLALVFLDGFAGDSTKHRLLLDWWGKVAPNGVLATHDYHAKWPSGIKAVDGFARDIGHPVKLTTEREYPSAYFLK